MAFVYLIRNGNSFLFKVGITNDVESRLAQLQTGNPIELAIESSYEFPNAEIVEKVLHQKWEYCRERGEWFDLNTEDLGQFEQICTLLGGTPYVPNAEVSSPDDVEEAEVVQEILSPNALAKWDFSAMFSDGWRMEVLGKGKYWQWRERKHGGKTIYGGRIADLPNSIEEMRRIYEPTNALGMEFVSE